MPEILAPIACLASQGTPSTACTEQSLEPDCALSHWESPIDWTLLGPKTKYPTLMEVVRE